MQLEHAARWTHDLERLKVFYLDHFGATPSARYVNERRGFASYFLSLDAGARLEITTIVGLQAARAAHGAGYAHLAFAPGSSARVDSTTAELRAAGCTILRGCLVRSLLTQSVTGGSPPPCRTESCDLRCE